MNATSAAWPRPVDCADIKNPAKGAGFLWGVARTAVHSGNATFNQTIRATFSNATFNQTIRTTFSNATFDQTIRPTFSNATFNQTIRTTFSNATFDQTIRTTFSNAAFDQTIRAALSNATFNQTIRTAFSHTAFDQTIRTTFSQTAFDQFVRTAFSDQGVNRGSGESVDSEDRKSDTEKSLAFHDGVLRGVVGWYGADVTPGIFYENFIAVMVNIDVDDDYPKAKDRSLRQLLQLECDSLVGAAEGCDLLIFGQRTLTARPMA